jgi:hypothetical protein
LSSHRHELYELHELHTFTKELAKLDQTPILTRATEYQKTLIKMQAPVVVMSKTSPATSDGPRNGGFVGGIEESFKVG